MSAVETVNMPKHYPKQCNLETNKYQSVSPSWLLYFSNFMVSEHWSLGFRGHVSGLSLGLGQCPAQPRFNASILSASKSFKMICLGVCAVWFKMDNKTGLVRNISLTHVFWNTNVLIDKCSHIWHFQIGMFWTFSFQCMLFAKAPKASFITETRQISIQFRTWMINCSHMKLGNVFFCPLSQIFYSIFLNLMVSQKTPLFCFFLLIHKPTLFNLYECHSEMIPF